MCICGVGTLLKRQVRSQLAEGESSSVVNKQNKKARDCKQANVIYFLFQASSFRLSRNQTGARWDVTFALPQKYESEQHGQENEEVRRMFGVSPVAVFLVYFHFSIAHDLCVCEKVDGIACFKHSYVHTSAELQTLCVTYDSKVFLHNRDI